MPMISNRRTTLKMIGAGMIGASFAGCLGDDDDDLTEVNVVTPHYGLWDTSIWYIVEQEMGFFEDEGINLNRIDSGGGAENIRIVQGGDAQLSDGVGVTGLFAAYRDGANVVGLANDWNSATDFYWYSLPDSGITELEDLEGKDIAAGNPGSSANMIANAAVEQSGLNDVNLVDTGGLGDGFSLLMQDVIDASRGVGHFFIPQLEEGEVQDVFWGDEITPFDNMTSRITFGDADWVEENPEITEGYHRAYVESVNWAYDNQDRALELWSEVTEMEIGHLEAALELYPPENMDRDAIVNLDEANRLAVEFDFIDEPMSDGEIDELIDTEYLP